MAHTGILLPCSHTLVFPYSRAAKQPWQKTRSGYTCQNTRASHQILATPVSLAARLTASATVKATLLSSAGGMI